MEKKLHPGDVLANVVSRIELLNELCIAKLESNSSIDAKAVEGIASILDDIRSMVQEVRQAV